MRNLLLTLLLLTSLPLFAQTRLNGKFERVSHNNMIWWGNDIFWLDSLGGFKFIKATDAGFSEGKGFYEITDTELILEFEDPDTTMPDVNGSYLVKNLSAKNVIQYNLNVTDEKTGEPMYGAAARIKVNNKYRMSEEVNSEGYANIIISKIDLPCKIEVGYIGYYLFEYTVNDTLSRELEIKLIEDKYPFVVSFYNKNEILKFDVRQVTNNSFHLKSQDENGFQDWLLFNKTGEYNDK